MLQAHEPAQESAGTTAMAVAPRGQCSAGSVAARKETASCLLENPKPPVC